MKKNFNFALKHMDGKELSEEGIVLTAKKIIVDSLLAPDVKKVLSGEKFLEHYNLAQDIHDSSGEIDLSPEQISLIKKAIENYYISPLVVGQMQKYLNE